MTFRGLFKIIKESDPDEKAVEKMFAKFLRALQKNSSMNVNKELKRSGLSNDEQIEARNMGNEKRKIFNKCAMKFSL
ncbi:hypothetical protein [Paenibacillus albus]|uniref:Uncharacterized protein n=1 Tax=Paenibacillus albus TaxID=2495582 RepID=A0A3S9A3W1_9BACL|nr:hypothetical protein [Paenibacillus albus]AZN40413.1 hypothetical protein EJC50_12695 [Paenibacillus albus]